MGYQIAPDAHIFHAMDRSWWAEYGDDAIAHLNSACHVYSGSPAHAEQYGIRPITWDGQDGCSSTKGHCHGGELSGIQLLQIVSWYKPDLVLMLGYDNQGSHWHPDYPNHMRNGGTIDQTSAKYAKLHTEYPCPLFNCSRETNIWGIPTMMLEAVSDAIEARQFPENR